MLDECRVCGRVTGGAGAYRLRSDLDGSLAALSLPEDATVCLPAGSTVGVHTLRLTALEKPDVSCEATVDVRPFGYVYGLERNLAPADSLPWVPDVMGIDDPPIVRPGREGWSSGAINHPSFIRYQGLDLLYYAGGHEEEGTDEEAYAIGVAVKDETGRFVPYAQNPLLGPDATGAVAGDWNYDHQNTPEPVVVDDVLWLYYNGYDTVRETLAIGVVTSTDGFEFHNLGSDPAIPGGVSREFVDGARAHPSVIVRDGVFEMWFASGTLEIGYAISEDGITFEEYCGGPVFQGAGEASWDQNVVKAPDVYWDGEWYEMMYSGCDKTCRQIGWAMSRDGLHWVAHDEPILPVGERGAWNSETTQGGSLFVDGDRWHVYYAASNQGLIQVGYAWADKP